MHKKFVTLLALLLSAACPGQEAGFLESGPALIDTVKVRINPETVIEFRIVPLRIGDAPFATREFWLGGRGAGGFKEPPTRCMLAGTLTMPVEQKPDWCILMGMTELTTAQWNSVLGLPAPVEADAKLPITKISRADVATFLEKANEQMHNIDPAARVQSPLHAAFANSFLRLPTEAEWEFSARGGAAVDATRFDKATPYEGDLNRFEWFFGQNSSKGKLKPAGVLAPNPLGIHDMLGNVSEMVEGLYQTEYSQGRAGGLVIRGGDFRMEEADLRSSLRIEVPCLLPEGLAYRSSTVGLRLALGSTIVTSMARSAELDAEWSKYAAARIQPNTSLPATASLAQSSGQEIEEIDRLARSLAKNLEIGDGKTLSAKETLALMETQTASLRGRMDAAESYFAKGAVRLASLVSTESMANIAKKKTYEEMSKTPGTDVKTNISLMDSKLREAAAVMEDSCKMLSQVSEAAAAKAFDEHLSMLEEKQAKNQIAATKVARKISLDYLKNRRMDLDQWRSELQKLSLEMFPKS